MSENYFYPSRQSREDLKLVKDDAAKAAAVLKKMQKTVNGRTIAFPEQIARLSTTISELFKEEAGGIAVLGNDEYYRQSKAAYEAWRATLQNKTCADKTQEKPVRKPAETVATVIDDGSVAHAEKTARRFKAPKQKYRPDKDRSKTNGNRPREEIKRARKISVLDC